ncbi:MAG: ABC transporter permease [Candidatus Promineifilaceae bacterium]|nr:ABC transporter permease [Candidatus Promineifilaceae bacterium]
MTTRTGEKRFFNVSWINDNNISVVYLIGIVAIAIVIMSFLDEKFLAVNNLFNVLNQQSTLGIATIGVAIALFAGCIDLTVGNLLASTAAIAALMLRQDMSDGMVIVLTCAIGLGFGLLNGLIVVKSRIDTFIATLGLMSVYQGLALIIPKGNNVYLEGRFSWFGTYKVFGIIPLPVIYFVAFTIIAYFVTRYLKFGRKLYSIGGNSEAAFLAGINLDLNKTLAYGVSGFCAAFTSLIVISRIGQSSPAMGIAYPLETIAAAVIGGVSLSGGKGTIPGVFMGVILLGLIRNSLNILRVPSFYQYVMLGSVIIIAVTLSNLGSIRKSGGSG